MKAARDNRRIAVPSSCTSPNLFAQTKVFENLVNGNGLRLDGRNLDDLKPMCLKVGLIPAVTGSAYLECNKTKLVCTVNGPRDITKSEFSSMGQLNCEFKYALFSCQEKQPYLPTAEEQRCSKVLQEALEPVVLLQKFPKARLDISVLILENNGGALSAAITCAGAALSNAGIEMYALPVGCSLVVLEEQMLLDPTAAEENFRKEGVNTGRLALGMMPAYSSQVIYLEKNGSLESKLYSQGLKKLHQACQVMATDIRLCLKQHLQKLAVDSAEEGGDMGALKLFQPHKYMSTFLEHEVRPDGRQKSEFRPVMVTGNPISTAAGSALIRLGETCVLCGVKAELSQPVGCVVPNVSLTPICSSQFMPGPPPDQAQIYSQILADLWQTVLPPERLCLVPEKLGWCLFVEVTCLSHDGNVLDACVLAMMAALRNTRLPEVCVESMHVKEHPLVMDTTVFSVTFASFESGVVADPTAEEESLADGTLTLFSNGSQFKLQTFGNFKEDDLFTCIQQAKIQNQHLNACFINQ